MKKTQIVATLAFAVILGVAIPVIGIVNSYSVSAAELDTELSTSVPTSVDGDTSTISAATREEIQTAAVNPEITHITLSGDIIFSGDMLTINRPISAAPLTIDLNNHNITREDNSKYAMSFKEGNVTITGSGKISGRNGIRITGSTTDVVESVNLTIDPQVVVEGRSVYALAIISETRQDTNVYGVKVTVNGTLQGLYGISVDGGVTNTVNAPIIIISDGAKLISQGAEDSTPIYAAGYATWNVGKVVLESPSAIAIKSGVLTFKNSTVTVDGPVETPDPTTGKIIGTSSVFQLEHHNSYADNIILNINGGKYESKNTNVFYEYGNLTPSRTATLPADINITSGEFIAKNGEEAIFGGTLDDGEINIEISGGTFQGTDVANFKENGYLVGNLNIGTNGTVYNPSYNRPSTDVEAPEGPSEPVEPSDPTVTPDDPQDENKVPDTGIISERGIISAVSTIIPMLIVAGFALMFFSGKIHERRRLRHLASLESEMSAEIDEIVDDTDDEPIIERFIAVPIARDEPITATVDPFVPHH